MKFLHDRCGCVRESTLLHSANQLVFSCKRELHRHVDPATPYGVVGEIDQRGDGVRDFQVGDRVAVVGSKAAYRTLRADRLARVQS